MKKTKILLFIGIGLLAFLPFIRVSVAAPPDWVGIAVGDTYIWEYETDSTVRDGAWTTDGVALLIFANMDSSWIGWVDDGEMGAIDPGNLTHVMTVVDDLAADIEYATGYQSVLFSGAVSYQSEFVNVDWADKETGVNIWNGIIIEEEADFVEHHSGLAGFFSIYGFGYHTMSPFVPSGDFYDWDEIVTLASAVLTDATVTALTRGFKITVAASAWTTNTLAVELSVTFDECGLLELWDLTYGGDSIQTITLQAGSDCTPYVTPVAPGIPGYELPIIIGTISVISMILVKKIKNK